MPGRFRNPRPTAAGADGVWHRAEDAEGGGDVDLLFLAPLGGEAGPARDRRLRLAALLTHPTARRVRALGLEGDRPFVALEPAGPAPWSAPSGWREGVSAGVALAEGLAEGHRLGLAHGGLGPGALAGPAEGQTVPRLDWTGLDPGPPAGVPGPPPVAEWRGGPVAEPADDLRALGGLVAGWIGAHPAPPWDDPEGPDPGEVRAVLRALQADDPDDRPGAAQAAARLSAALGGPAPPRGSSGGDSLVGFGATGGPHDRAQAPTRVGRFTLGECLGQGGLAAVYRAVDPADGAAVAVKVLHGHGAARPSAVRGLAREARILRHLRSPYVVRLVEAGEDGGAHFLVLEFVDGQSLARRLDGGGRLDEPEALRVIADAARGLAEAHARGVVHLDLAPANLLLVRPGADLPAAVAAKVSDFGAAREVGAGGLVSEGWAVGTPQYMAPELQTGGAGPPADVYALGATLFHALAGRPPFDGGSAVALLARHRDEPPPRLRDLNPSASEGAEAVVARALAKRPEERYADAGRMLDDLERLLRGEPVVGAGRPRAPAAGPLGVVRFTHRWELAAPPDRLWPLVADADRVGRALGLPAFEESGPPTGPPGSGFRRGVLRVAGLRVAVHDHPWEWAEGRSSARVRAFDRGPFLWAAGRVELEPGPGGGTALTHRVEVAPRGLAGRALARALAGPWAARALGRVYRQADAAAVRPGRAPGADPFGPPHDLPRRARARLDAWLGALGRRGLDPGAVERVGAFLANAPPADLARVRPLALARRLGVDPGQAVAACLHGALDGILTLSWRASCPSCRTPTARASTLRGLGGEATCPACGARHEVDPAAAELVAAADPGFRAADARVFAPGHPLSTPGALAQAVIGPGGGALLPLGAAEGDYRVRALGGPGGRPFRVEAGGARRRLDLTLGGRSEGGPTPVLGAGGQALEVFNDTGEVRVVRVERAGEDPEALTAAGAWALPLFRSLFPGEAPPPGVPEIRADLTLVVAEPDRPGDLYRTLGDARAHARVDELLRRVEAHLHRRGGAPAERGHERAVAAFADPADAVRAAVGLPAEAEGRPPAVRVGVHRGPALSGTIGGRTGYFGATATLADALPALAVGGGVVLSPAAAEAPGVADALRDAGLCLASISTPDARNSAYRVIPAADSCSDTQQ